MNISRRDFLGTVAGAGAGLALPGCCSFCCCGNDMPAIAVQLYSIREYIMGRRDPKTKKYDGNGVGPEKAMADLAKIGYKSVEFAGYYGKSAKELKKMLDDNGLKPSGTHVSRAVFAPDVIKETIEFNLEYGNTHLICPGGGMWPPKGYTKGYDSWWKEMVEFYAKAADTANAYGCTLGYHNHTDEFVRRTAMNDGTLMWDYFFSNTPHNVCMEMDVGWAVCAGQDPEYWFKRFPGRSPTLHAKENAGYLDGPDQKRTYAPVFEGILGQPAKFADGKSVKGVDWDGLVPAARAAGVKYFVVECEKNAANLVAVTESFRFLKGKGLV